MNRRYDEATSEGSSVAVGSVLGHIVSEVPAPECTCTQALTRREVSVGGRGEAATLKRVWRQRRIREGRLILAGHGTDTGYLQCIVQ
jgi:hypothetical protein